MLIQIKCQNCGSNIKVDNDNKKYVCEYCGTEFILEETVNNFQTVNQYHTTQNIVKHIYGTDTMDASDFILNADVFASLGEFSKAEALYNKAIDANPADWRGWFGLVKVKTLNFTKIEDKSHLDYLSKAKKVATEDQKLEIEKIYSEFLLKIEKEKQRIAEEKRRIEEAQHKAYLQKQERLKQQKLEEERQRKKKKIGIISITIVLAVALVVSIPIISHMVAKSSAEKEADLQARNGLILEEKSDYYIVTGIEEFNENIIIPSTYKGKPVKEFTANVFSDNDSLKSIVIPDSITKIEARAFEGCNSLTSVTIGNGVTHIGGYAFMNCNSLENIAIGNGISSIEESVFWGCGALNYNEYNNVYYLGNNDNPYVCLMRAKDNNITSCVVNENTKIIYEQAFIDCYSLQNITFGKSVVSIAWSAFQTYGAALENIYYLGEITDWLEIEGLGGLMSKGKSSKNLYVNGQMLTDVVIPDTITSIPSYAFYGTTIESVIIGDSVTSIREYAFYNCQELTNITFSSTSEWFVHKFGSQGATGISPGILENFDIIKDFLISTYSSYWWSRR